MNDEPSLSRLENLLSAAQDENYNIMLDAMMSNHQLLQQRNSSVCKKTNRLTDDGEVSFSYETNN